MKIDLKRAAWFNGERLTGYSACIVIVSVIAIPWFFYDSVWRSGSDFQAFWTAGRLFITRGALSAYDLRLQSDLQRGMPTDGYIAFVHPPPFLLAIAPLGWLEYPWAFAVWNALTFTAWAVAAASICRRAAWPIVAFPGALLALAHAQIGLLCSSLICGSVAASRRYPYLAGALVGALVIKPQIAVLLPLAIVLAREPRIFVGAAVSSACLLLVPLLLFGAPIYEAFFANLAATKSLVAAGHPVFLQRMCSVYAAVRLLISGPAAIVAQVISAAGSIAFLVWSARRTTDYLALCAVAVTATCLTLPYLFSYDLPFLIIPLLWLGVEGHRHGWLDWEKVTLAFAYWGVLLCRAVAISIGVNPTPLLAVLLLGMIGRRLQAISPGPSHA